MEGKGLIHIYEGDGKGKTTVSVGLAVRFAGTGGKVLFTQFLKKNNSGELKILEKVENVQLLLCERNYGFTFQMTPEEKREAAEYYTAHLHRVLAEVQHMTEQPETRDMQEPDGESQAGKKEKQSGVLLVLDEILGAYDQNMVNRQELLDFLKGKPDDLEVVLTGRNPSLELLELADYVTFMKKKKHPYDKGIKARRGIEW